MGIVKMEDVLAWDHEGAIYYLDFEDQGGEATPLTENDFSNQDVVTCDGCHNKRIC